MSMLCRAQYSAISRHLAQDLELALRVNNCGDLLASETNKRVSRRSTSTAPLPLCRCTPCRFTGLLIHWVLWDLVLIRLSKLSYSVTFRPYRSRYAKASNTEKRTGGPRRQRPTSHRPLYRVSGSSPSSHHCYRRSPLRRNRGTG